MFIKIKFKITGRKKKPLIKYDNHFVNFTKKHKTKKQKTKTEFDSFCRTRFGQQREMRVGTMKRQYKNYASILLLLLLLKGLSLFVILNFDAQNTLKFTNL